MLRVTSWFGDSKTENMATPLMYLLLIFAWKVCLDVEVDWTLRVVWDIPSITASTLKAFSELRS